MNGVFVTGTDTGVGKSLFAAALLLKMGEAGVRAAGWKPVAAGCRRVGGQLISEDAELLAACAPLRLPLATVNPVPLAPAIAPHLAAAEAGIGLDAARLAGLRPPAEFLVTEGAGGWRVPLNDAETLADLARLLGLPVVLVVGLKLGCLNHALLSAEAVAGDGLALAGWVGNPAEPAMDREAANLATLAHRLGPPLAVLPRVPAGTPLRRARQLAARLPAELARRLAGGSERTR